MCVKVDGVNIKKRGGPFGAASFRVHVPSYFLRACNFIGTKAASAYIYLFGFAVYNCSYSLDVWLPGPFRADVRVTHVHTASGGFATYFAKVCHIFHLQA